MSNCHRQRPVKDPRAPFAMTLENAAIRMMICTLSLGGGCDAASLSDVWAGTSNAPCPPALVAYGARVGPGDLRMPPGTGLIPSATLPWSSPGYPARPVVARRSKAMEAV